MPVLAVDVLVPAGSAFAPFELPSSHGAAGFLSLVAAVRCCFWCCCCLAFCLGCLGAGGLARPLLLPPSLPSPRACLLVFSGPVSVLLVPPSGYLVVSTTVRLSYLWHGVS